MYKILCFAGSPFIVPVTSTSSELTNHLNDSVSDIRSVNHIGAHYEVMLQLQSMLDFILFLLFSYASIAETVRFHFVSSIFSPVLIAWFSG